MIRDAIRSIGHNRLSSALASAGVGLATVLAVAVASIYGSLVGSVESFSTQLRGAAEMEIVGPTSGAISPSVVAKVRDGDGVAAAVPVVVSPITLDGEQSLLIGIDEQAAALGGVFSSDRAIAAINALGPRTLILGPHYDPDTASREHSVFTTTGGSHVVSVVGALGLPEAEAFNSGRFALGRLNHVKTLLGRGDAADMLLVVTDDVTDIDHVAVDLTDRLDDRFSVSRSSTSLDQLAAIVEPMRLGLLFAGSGSFIVAAILMLDAVAMSIERRRSDIALLRTMGADPRRLTVTTAIEAGLLGFVGGVVGAVAGLGAAALAVTALPPFLLSAFGVEITFHAAWWSVPVAVVAGAGLAAASGALAAIRIASISPAEAIRNEVAGHAGEPRVRAFHYVVGAAIAVAAVAVAATVDGEVVAIVGVAAAFVAVASLALAAVQLMPRLARLLFSPLPRLWLATEATFRSGHRRLSVTMTVVALAVGLVVMIEGLARNQVESIRETLAPLADVDLLVDTNPGDQTQTNVLIPEAVVEELDAVEGASVTGTGQFAFASHDGKRIVLQGVGAPSSRGPAFKLASKAAQQALLDGEAVIVSDSFARRTGQRTGSTLELQTLDGPQRMRVADEVPSAAWPDGLVVLPMGLLQDWYDRPGVSWVELNVDDSAPAHVEAEIEAIAAAAPVKVYVVSGSDQVAAIAGAASQAISALRVVQLVILVVMAMVIMNAQISVVWQRRKEFAVLRAVAATARDNTMVAAIEVLTVGVVAGVIGGIGGSVAHWLAVDAAASLTGFPVFFEPEPAGAVIAVPAAITFGIAGSLLMARSIAQVKARHAFA